MTIATAIIILKGIFCLAVLSAFFILLFKSIYDAVNFLMNLVDPNKKLKRTFENQTIGYETISDLNNDKCYKEIVLKNCVVNLTFFCLDMYFDSEPVYHIINLKKVKYENCLFEIKMQLEDKISYYTLEDIKEEKI